MTTAPADDSGNTMIAIGLVLLALVFAAGGVFYLTQNTDFLAAEMGKHYKHAVLSFVLAVVCLVGANFMRPKNL